MFGEVDTEGPSVTDAALVGGGACAIAATLVAGLPVAILGVGIASVGIGSILPIRSVIRRGKHRAHDRRLRDLIGDGQLLDIRGRSTKELADTHNALIASVDATTAVGIRVRSIAHGLVEEVATLLEGHPPETDRQRAYVALRLAALHDLQRALTDHASDHAEQNASVDARLAIESHAARSALTEAAELSADLSGDR